MSRDALTRPYQRVLDNASVSVDDYSRRAVKNGSSLKTSRPLSNSSIAVRMTSCVEPRIKRPLPGCPGVGQSSTACQTVREAWVAALRHFAPVSRRRSFLAAEFFQP